MIFEKVRAILSEQFDVEESDITTDTRLFDDLNADSLDLVDFISTVEDEFGMDTIEDDAINSINTVGDVIYYIKKILPGLE